MATKAKATTSKKKTAKKSTSAAKLRDLSSKKSPKGGGKPAKDGSY